jgi:hypothetical protein
MHDVIVFLSTPRSATQWIAETLATAYADRLLVRHEPLSFDYRPNSYFRRPDRLAEQATLPAIAAHLDWIDDVRRHTTYVEIGYQNYAAIPLFIQRFAPALKIVHHVRHPATNAASLVSHRWYQKALRNDGLNAFALLEPSAPGAIHRGFADRWPSLSPFGKCLFFWCEINAYGFELEEQYGGDGFLRTTIEELADARTGALRNMLDFLGLHHRREIEEAYDKKIDRWRRKAVVGFDCREVADHPEVLALAERLGYDVEGVDSSTIEDRFAPKLAFLVRPLYTYLMEHPSSLRLLSRLKRQVRLR